MGSNTITTGFDLPRFVKIKGPFAASIGHEDDGSLKYYRGADVVPHEEFEIRMAKSGNGEFSIKSRYSNKYMVLQGQDSDTLTMAATEPNEDTSQWSCTLFRVVEKHNEKERIHLLFVRTERYVRMSNPYVEEPDAKLFVADFGLEKRPGVIQARFALFHFVDFLGEREDQGKTILVSSFPRYVMLKDTSGNWLGQDEEDGSLKFHNDIPPRLHKFELERAKTGKGLCHIKSCFNNKYWALQEGTQLAAVAVAPNEDQSQQSCTLFRPLLTKSDCKLIQLRFVHSGKFVCFREAGGNVVVGALELQKDDDENAAILNVLDAEAVPTPTKHAYDAFRYVVLKCNFNNNYLRQTNKVDNGFANGSIKVDEIDPVSPNCKFELERPKADDKGLCHIRSCYNNKYLTMEHGIIKAVATKSNPRTPTEDGSKEVEEDKVSKNKKQKVERYHTLFQLVHVADDAIQLRFVHSQGLVAYSHFTDSLFEVSSSEEDDVEFMKTKLNVIDWERYVMLPTHVAFKGGNGKYLAVREDKGKYYLKFDGSDIGDKAIAHEIIYSPDRLSIRIRSKQTGMFWWSNGYEEWIRADTEEAYADTERTLFEPIKARRNAIALRKVVNKKVCLRNSNDWLSGYAESLTESTYMTVEETVSKRVIKNVNYRLEEARIYDETIKTMVTREASNENSENETVQLKLSYQNKSVSSWEAGFAASQNIETEFSCGVPLVGDIGVKVSLGFEETRKWGTTHEETSDVETTHVVTVPKCSRVQVRLIATEGKCDVPFSYVVVDTLVDGSEITRHVDGGMYNGVSNYNFQYHTKKLPLLNDGDSSKGLNGAHGKTLKTQTKKI